MVYRAQRFMSYTLRGWKEPVSGAGLVAASCRCTSGRTREHMCVRWGLNSPFHREPTPSTLVVTIPEGTALVTRPLIQVTLLNTVVLGMRFPAWELWWTHSKHSWDSESNPPSHTPRDMSSSHAAHCGKQSSPPHDVTQVLTRC